MVPSPRGSPIRHALPQLGVRGLLLLGGVPRGGRSHILYIVSPQVNLERQELYGLFAFCLLLPAVFGPQDRGSIRWLLRSWPMASLGVISYGIYLWHLNLIDQ